MLNEVENEKPSFISKLKLIIPGSIALIIFIILSILVLKDKTYDFDIDITHFFLDHRGEKGNALYYCSRILTEFGDIICLAIILIALAIYYKLDQRFFYLGAILAAAVVFNSIYKIIIDRDRPNAIYMWVNETSASFPSGHSVSSMTFYLSLIFINFKFEKNKVVKAIMIALSVFFIIIIPITRLILSVHYFTDVLAGMMFGVFAATFGLLIGYPLVDLIWMKIYKKIKKAE